MSKYITKYFQFIGVEQEGLRRIILLTIVGWYLFCFFIIYVDGLIHYDYREIYQGYGQENTKEIVLDIYQTFYLPTIIFFGIPIIFSVGIKIITWIIDGFKQGKSSNE